jgi:16S rRNA (uracil1498-N3)-methyltransferase
VVRLFLPSARLTDEKLSITDEKAHYLLSVLRCREGDNFIIFDGRGTCFLAVIRETRKREVITEVIETFPCDLESPLHSILVQGILKGEKMDVVIQKTTELGISEIVPAATERSQLRDTRRVKRWEKIAEEAARQSGRSVVPVIREPVDLRNYFTSSFSHSKLQGFIFYEEGGKRLSEAVKVFPTKGRNTSSPLVEEGGFLILVGPEGGFTKEEVICAQERGLSVVSLGKRVLRAETAAISAVTLVQYLFGDMG